MLKAVSIILSRNFSVKRIYSQFTLFSIVILCSFSANATEVQKVVKPAPQISISTHDAFFNNIKKHCGKAFNGKVVINDPEDDFPTGNMVMHVRKCTNTELQIPFHIGDDASRTWIITKTGAGLTLKHDHRKPDGNYVSSTMYGGHTLDSGFNEVQSFPADSYSKQLFVEHLLPESIENVWQIIIYPDTFSYRLTRPAREFQVDFDLTNPIEAPPAPWGYEDE